jgi:ATP-binding cassette subfamily B protein
MIKKKQFTLFKFILKHLKKYPVAFFFIFSLYGTLALERVYLPYLFGNIIDIMNSAIDKENWWNLMRNPIITTIVATLGMDMLFRIQELLTEYYIPRFKANIRREVFEYSINHSSRFFAENHAGSVAGKINNLSQSSFQIISKLYSVLSPIILTIIIAGITILFMNMVIGLVYSIWAIIHIGYTVLSSKTLEQMWEESAEKTNVVQGKISDSINNIMNVRLFMRQKNELDYYQKYENENIDYSFKAGLFGVKVKAILSFIAFVGLCTITYTIIFEWRKDYITTGEVASIFAIFINSILLAWWLSYEIIFFYMDVGQASQAMTLLNENHEIENALNAKNLVVSRLNSVIEFKNVNFSYGDKLFFQNMNIKINTGEKIGLVGFSGAGKTTFANLIMREFDIISGEILINGHNIKNVTLSSLKESISYITQDVNMFHRSVKENIAFGIENPNNESILKASEYACAKDFIDKLENKYDTIIGEKGAKLSGGQKQRISIARAFLKDAPIIILDEATSALDSVTEKKIRDAINLISKNKTTIIIAHRLSTLKDVDRILVFENGNIIEDGSHAELLSKEKGYYKRLWDSQNDYYEVYED